MSDRIKFNKRTEKLFFKIIFLLLFIFFHSLVFAENEEPPIWKSDLSDHANLMIEAELTAIDFKKNQLIYQVRYNTPHNLITEATLDLSTKALLKQVFMGRWIVIFEYKNELYKSSKLPTKFIIYEYQGVGKLGKVLNIYTFKEAIGNGKIVYIDSHGKRRIIHCDCFQII